MAWIIRSSKGCLGIGGSAGPETIGVGGWEGIGYGKDVKSVSDRPDSPNPEPRARP